MQNVDLGHTKVIQIRQRETLSHQGAIIHENCCSAAQWKNGEVDVRLSLFGLLLLTQPLHSSEQPTWNFLVTLAVWSKFRGAVSFSNSVGHKQ